MDGDRVEIVLHEVAVLGLRIAYARAGSGEPLVLLHGGASDHREWRSQIEELSDQYLVIAWDTTGLRALIGLPAREVPPSRICRVPRRVPRNDPGGATPRGGLVVRRRPCS